MRPLGFDNAPKINGRDEHLSIPANASFFYSQGNLADFQPIMPPAKLVRSV